MGAPAGKESGLGTNVSTSGEGGEQGPVGGEVLGRMVGETLLRKSLQKGGAGAASGRSSAEREVREGGRPCEGSSVAVALGEEHNARRPGGLSRAAQRMGRWMRSKGEGGTTQRAQGSQQGLWLPSGT